MDWYKIAGIIESYWFVWSLGFAICAIIVFAIRNQRYNELERLPHDAHVEDYVVIEKDGRVPQIIFSILLVLFAVALVALVGIKIGFWEYVSHHPM